MCCLVPRSITQLLNAIQVVVVDVIDFSISRQFGRPSRKFKDKKCTAVQVKTDTSTDILLPALNDTKTTFRVFFVMWPAQITVTISPITRAGKRHRVFGLNQLLALTASSYFTSKITRSEWWQMTRRGISTLFNNIKRQEYGS